MFNLTSRAPHASVGLTSCVVDVAVLREKPAQPPLTTRSLDYLGFWVLEAAATAFVVFVFAKDGLVGRGEGCTSRSKLRSRHEPVRAASGSEEVTSPLLSSRALFVLLLLLFFYGILNRFLLVNCRYMDKKLQSKFLQILQFFSLISYALVVILHPVTT